MDYQSPLARVRGLGSAKSGTGHWWLQRVTAVALLPLTYWLLVFLDSSLNQSYQQTVGWLADPFHSAAIWSWLLLTCYHAVLGLQVVIEDYLADEGRKIIAVWVVNLIFLFLALAASVALLRIVLAG